jgi:hypothetical protein
MAWATRTERIALIALACGCASSPLGQLRFENRSPIVALADQRPIAEPEEHEDGKITASAGALLRTEPMYLLSVPGAQPALDVNALEEVPDSSWFTNRIGQHELSPAELARGPGSGGPDRSRPLRVLSSKQAGTAPGLVVEDAAGERYFLKLDPIWPETETGADVVVQRLLWAAGYNVPDNEVIGLARSELVLAEDATQKDELGVKRPFTGQALDALLAAAPLRRDGRYRVLASKFLPGKPLGGFAPLGLRSDDANDRIPHEHRRTVRAQQVFFAWLGHTDVKPANTLDTWIEQPEGSGRGYVLHHLLDFGKALGVWGRDRAREADGYAAQFEYGVAWRSLLSFGLWRRPWEGVHAPSLRGVGRYEAEHFDPAIYSPTNPYAPFLYADRQDGFWAARIIARFRRDHIAAAVDAGRYSDPRARDYLIDTIVARQRKTLRHWFAQVAPLDRFRVQTSTPGVRVCAVDLALLHGVAALKGTRYRAQSYDYDGDRLGPARVASGARDGAVCIGGLPSASGDDEAYTMVAFEVWRGDEALPGVIVHLARPRGGGALRIIGIERS